MEGYAYGLTTNRFSNTAARLRQALARLIRASTDEIVSGNSSSYRLHLLANGILWHRGDEVLLVHGDLPSDISPWLAPEMQGVCIRYTKPKNHLPDL